MPLLESIQSAADTVQRALGSTKPEFGIVLGSGLGSFVDALQIEGSLSYDQIPGFRTSTVSGHSGRFVLGRLSGRAVLVMQGRVHLYEGYHPSEVVFPIRVMAKLGVSSLVVTNAAGCLNSSFEVPSLMLISDHLNLTGAHPLVGPNEESLGPRFPDMSSAYSAAGRAQALRVAKEMDLVLHEGVYAGMLGPTYETPAEVRMLTTLGADAVGMSTVHEVLAARHMGVSVMGVSCLSNWAAGLSAGALNHDEVKAAGAQVADQFSKFLQKWMERGAA